MNAVPITFDKLLSNITMCADDPRWCLVNGELQVKALAKQRVSTDSEMITLVLEKLKQEPSLRSDQIEAIWQKVHAYIKKSAELQEPQKQAFIEEIQEQLVLQAKDPGYLQTLIEILNIQKKRSLTYYEIQVLEDSLSLLCSERLFILALVLNKAVEYMQLLVNDSTGALGAKVSLSADEYVFDYDDLFDASSAEEVAIGISVEYAHQTFSWKKFKATVCEILQKDPTYASSPLIKIWKFFALKQEMYTAESLLNYLKECMPIRVVDSEDKVPFASEIEDLLHTSQMMKLFSQDVTAKTLDAMMTASNLYRQKSERLDALYSRSYAVLQEEIAKQKRFTPVETSWVFEYRLPTPDELHAIQLPHFSLQAFQKKIDQEIDLLSSQVLQHEELGCFRLLLNFFFSSDEGKFLEEQFCRVYQLERKRDKKSQPREEQKELIEQVAAISLQPEPKIAGKQPKKSKPKSRGINQRQRHPTYKTRPHERAPEPTPPTLPSSKAVALKQPPTPQASGYHATPISVAPRVRDWLKKSPVALQQESYKNLSSDIQEKMQVCHSYPITITHLLRQYGQHEHWHSKTTDKQCALYSAPGIIEWKDKRCVGFYADCFDGELLYHHYFHERPLHELRDRYAKTTSFIDEKDKRTIEKTERKKCL